MEGRRRLEEKERIEWKVEEEDWMRRHERIEWKVEGADWMEGSWRD